MRKIFFSFVLACIAIAASAQMSETPLKTFNDDYELRVFNYKNGDQIFLKWAYNEEPELIYLYDLSFALKKTITFSPATIPGFKRVQELWFNEGRDLKGDANMFVTEKLFKDDNLLEFIVETTDGWAIVNENYEVIFKKRYTEDWEWLDFRLLETKNGNLLEVSLYKWVQTGVECCYWPEGSEECVEECLIGESVEKIEIYALPGYSLSTLRSAAIQQLSNPFPNPAKTYIQLPYTLPEGVKEGTIRVINSQGQLIKTLHVDSNSEYVRLDTSRLPSGNYFYTLDTRGRKGESKQFIVNK